MTLEEFAKEFLSIPVAQLRVVEARNSGDRFSLIMYRKPPFQAEFVFWKPGTVVLAHCHPNFEGLGVHISGGMTMIVGDGEEQVNDLLRRSSVWPEKHLQGRMLKARPGQYHGGKTGMTGCTFWSLQKWNDGVEMTAASRDWVGPKIVTPELATLCV